MKKMLSIYIATLAVFLLGLLGISSSLVAADTAQDAVCRGIGAVSGDGTCVEGDGGSKADDTIITVINILSIIGGVIAVIMIMIAGIRFVTSSGDSGSVATARNTVIYAVVGLIIIALSQIIVRFVVERVSADPPPPEDSMLVEPLQEVA